MKVKNGFNLRDVCGEHIIVAEGDDNIDFSNIISMNAATLAAQWAKAGIIEGNDIPENHSVIEKEIISDENNTTGIDSNIEETKSKKKSFFKRLFG